MVTGQSLLADIAPDEWNVLSGAKHPFVSHAYLHALEASGSANADTGWVPAHLVVRDAQHLAAALPLYRKHHSWGEFVFDFTWANACQQAGLRYYPKLLTAVPFTPVTGPRLLGDKPEELIAAGLETMRAGQHLSWHVLFPECDERAIWKAHGFLPRLDVRFTWRDRHFRDFEGYLAALKQKRRKEIRRERRQVHDAGVHFEVLHGRDLGDEVLGNIYHCYARTYYLRGQRPYLTPECFRLLATALPNELVIFHGTRNSATIAVAICVRSAQTLYGRWWGALAELPGLHFEACYYQGIMYCLAHGLTRYDPGTQGEHKLARGFAPEPAWSLHRFNHEGLEAAVRNALLQETPMMQAYIEDCRRHLPFRKDD